MADLTKIIAELQAVLPPQIAEAFQRNFGRHGPGPAKAVEWFGLLADAKDFEDVSTVRIPRMYSMAWAARNGRREEFDEQMANVAAISLAYFLSRNNFELLRRRRMENFIFEHLTNNEGQHAFEIRDRLTGKVENVTPWRRFFERAEQDCRNWLAESKPLVNLAENN